VEYAQIKREEGLRPPSGLRTEDPILIAEAVWIEGLARIGEVPKVFVPWPVWIDDAHNRMDVKNSDPTFLFSSPHRDPPTVRPPASCPPIFFLYRRKFEDLLVHKK
jgi:hypothetical protein